MKKKQSEIIASVSGVRGIYGDTLTPESIIGFTSAYLKHIRKKGSYIVVGLDGRLHGTKVHSIVMSVISLSGFIPLDVWKVPTPTVQLAVEKSLAAGGIIITASHNPQEWNGLKFLGPDGIFLSGKEMSKIKETALKGSFKYAKLDYIAQRPLFDNWIERHIDTALKLKYINPQKIRRKIFTVVVDAVNSSGSVIVPALLKKLGCNVITLFCDGSGVFPHTPEPIPQNLTALSNAVKYYKADIGIAVDPDADRLVIITEKGEPFIEENTITTVVNFILKHSENKNNVVTVNLSTTRAVDDIARKYGAVVKRSPVGEINVVNEMKRNGSICGGEGSGGVIIPNSLGGHYGRDSLYGVVIILQEIAESGLTVSQYKEALPQYKIEKSKINNVKNPDAYLRKIVNENKTKNCKITTADGVKLDFDDYWLHYRKSNTEPVIRIIKETKSKR